MASPKSLAAPPQRAEWIPGSPASALTSSPESSASAGSPEVCAAAMALSLAFSAKLAPVSSGSGSPSLPADTVSTPNSASRSAISRTLPSLWLAMTRRMPRLKATPILSDGELLQLHELGDATLGERHQLIELIL